MTNDPDFRGIRQVSDQGPCYLAAREAARSGERLDEAARLHGSHHFCVYSVQFRRGRRHFFYTFPASGVIFVCFR
jgi:hypothetical protein